MEVLTTTKNLDVLMRVILAENMPPHIVRIQICCSCSLESVKTKEEAFCSTQIGGPLVNQQAIRISEKSPIF